VWAGASRVVTVRAELSRLRKQYTGLLAAQPYRIAGSVEVEVQCPRDMMMLLPHRQHRRPYRPHRTLEIEIQ
jgi:hypothetical protein